MNIRDLISPNIPPQKPEPWNWLNSRFPNFELVQGSGQFEELTLSEAVSEKVCGVRRIG